MFSTNYDEIAAVRYEII